MSMLALATSIVKKLQAAGHTAYFAGGWVRDFLMHHPSDDIDIATSASVEEIQALFSKTVPVGIAFGIVIVVEEGHTFEVATFRKESGYQDGRRPSSIQPTSPQEDAQRRDFTINGMFWDPLAQQLYDFVGGKEDLEKKILRAIGDPTARFLEDRLRMMRAVRYSTRFGFPIELATRQAIIEHASILLPSVAMERIWQEFKKMASFGHFAQSLQLLYELQLLQTIFPSLKNDPPIEKLLRPLSLFPKNTPPIAYILELFPESNLEEQRILCDYLKLSNAEREIVEELHMAKNLLQIPDMWQQQLEKVEWAHFYARPHCNICIAIKAAHLDEKERPHFFETHKKRQDQLQRAIFRIQSNTPIVKAADLLKAGVSPGKTMGLMLKAAERININEDLDDKEAIIARLLPKK